MTGQAAEPLVAPAEKVAAAEVAVAATNKAVAAEVAVAATDKAAAWEVATAAAGAALVASLSAREPSAHRRHGTYHLGSSC